MPPACLNALSAAPLHLQIPTRVLVPALDSPVAQVPAHRPHRRLPPPCVPLEVAARSPAPLATVTRGRVRKQAG